MIRYEAKKSLWTAVTPMCILFCWLIIPVFIILFRMLSNSFKTVEFYDDKVVEKSGVLNKIEKSNVFTGVVAVSVKQSLLGRLLGYGDVRIDTRGKFDINTTGIKNPNGLKKYLEEHIISAKDMTFFSDY